MRWLFLVFFLFPFHLSGQQPPPSEYPYPGKAKKNNKEIPEIEKPVKIDSDGVYYYSKKRKKKKSVKIRSEKHNQKNKNNKNGSHIYKNKMLPEASKFFSLLAGVYGPPDIQPKRAGGLNYRQMYSDKQQFVLRVEYDLRLFHSFFIKFGSGLTQASGEGQFLGGNQEIKPREKFQFFIFPTTVSLSYKLNLLKIQYLTPYLDGGMGYFGFMESRSDNKKTHFGGALVSTFSLGLLIAFPGFQDGPLVFDEYEISQSWFNLQYRRIIGLNDRKDFTSDMITGGIAFGF